MSQERNTNPEISETRRYFEMFFIERKKEKPNVGKIVAISVGVTFAVAAAVYGVYMFCRKYCKLCDCGDELILFATKTCPNCKMAEKFLNDAGLSFQKVYAEDAPEMVTDLGIKKAPVLAIMKNGVLVNKIDNVSNIRKFAEEA